MELSASLSGQRILREIFSGVHRASGRRLCEILSWSGLSEEPKSICRRGSKHDCSDVQLVRVLVSLYPSHYAGCVA
jgi:hypothetical protein